MSNEYKYIDGRNCISLGNDWYWHEYGEQRDFRVSSTPGKGISGRIKRKLFGKHEWTHSVSGVTQAEAQSIADNPEAWDEYLNPLNL